MSKRSKCCIIGVPDHQGIINVGGRIGAAQGPSAFRRVFSRFQGKIGLENVLVDLGDVSGLTSDVKANHRRTADLVHQGHQLAPLTIVVGGGHDHGFSHLLGISDFLQSKSPKFRLGCINIDAHLDVRKPSPWITSGSPFYLALELGVLHPKRFLEFGIQSHCNSAPLWKYVEDKKVKVIPFSQLRGGNVVGVFQKNLTHLSSICDAIAISLDMDAAASAYSPGVSAPQSEGFTAMDVIAMMEIAGQKKKVISLGIFELNPVHDVDDRSARLAATAAYHFIESALS